MNSVLTFDKISQWADDATEVYIRDAKTKQYIGSYCRHRGGKRKTVQSYSAYIPLPCGSHEARFTVEKYGTARAAFKAMKLWCAVKYTLMTDADKNG